MGLASILRSSIREAIEVVSKPHDEAANSSVMKVDLVEAKEDASSKEDEDDVSEEEDDDEEASPSDEDNASDVDSASEEDIALVLGGLKTQIEEDDALMLGVKKYNHVKVDDAELDPILRTPDDDLVTRFNKRPREGTIGETSDGLATKHNKRLREERIVDEELKNYVASINTKIKAKDKPFSDRIGRNKRLIEETIDAEEMNNYMADINAKIKANDLALSNWIGRNIMKHLRPFLAEIKGIQLKNVVSAEDAAAQLNAYEEAFFVSIARMVVKNLTPCLAKVLNLVKDK